MSVDAIMVVRPKSPGHLRDVLDPEVTHATLQRLGANVTFVSPRGLDEIMAERKAAFAAFLGQK